MTDTIKKHMAKIDISPERGYMHIIQVEENNDKVTAIANGGAQLMNSPHYSNRLCCPISREIVRSNEAHMNSFMFGFTHPGDVFLHRFTTKARLEKIKQSFEDINIQLSTDWHKVDGAFPQIGNIMPQVIDPDTLKDTGLDNVANANLAAYYKDVSQQVWMREGIPTPETVYIQRNLSPNIIEDKLHALSKYQELVINIVGGSGGFGLRFVSFRQAYQEIVSMFSDFPEENLLMIQGRLPLESSPGIIFTITDNETRLLQVSEQRFAAPGVHGGNLWYKNIIEEYEKQYPGFVIKSLAAAEALKRTGVRGQVNIDILLLSKKNAERYQLSQILAREANVRSSGSSPIARFVSNGNIRGNPITTVLTNTHFRVKEVDFEKFQATPNPNITTIVYNYAEDGTIFFATMGTEKASIKDLIDYEKDTLRRIDAR